MSLLLGSTISRDPYLTTRFFPRQITHIGVDAFQDIGHRVLCWSTDLVNGGPIPGVNFTVLDSEGVAVGGAEGAQNAHVSDKDG